LNPEGTLDPACESLRVFLEDSGGAEVWRQNELPAAAGRGFSVILPPGVLRPGDYVLSLEGRLRSGAYAPAGRYRFRVLPPQP
jgi:hypothetical protein